MNYTLLPKSNITISHVDTLHGEQTMLFIHGLASSLLCWDYNIDHFKYKYRCIAIDLPGNGFSTAGDFPYTMEWFAGIVKEFIDELQLSNIILVGHSMGGYISALITDKNPHLVDRLILVATAGLEHYNAIEQTMSNALMNIGSNIINTHSEILKTYKNSFYLIETEEKKLIEHLISIVKMIKPEYLNKYLKRSIRSLMSGNIINIINKYKEKSFIMFGQNDQLIPTKKYINPNISSLINSVSKNINGLNKEIIPLAGHFVQWEQYYLFNKSLEQFLKRD